MLSFFSAFLATLIAVLQVANAIPLDVNSQDSIKDASSTLAYGLMSWYSNNQSDTDVTKVGTLPEPLYWWEAGAVWGGLIDYWAYTGDTSYNPTVTQALLAQIGPDANFMPPAYFSSLGNDDQAFWAIASLNAAEYGFPVPNGNSSTMWLDLTETVFNTMVPRWFTTQCSGGLQWQVFESNPGWGYKNSVSNGAFFQIAARLAKITGNQTYIDWSNKIWDWMEGVGFIDQSYNVFDGASSDGNCSEVNKVIWSYNECFATYADTLSIVTSPSMLLYGTAALYNHSSDDIWAQRTQGLMTACQNTFFTPFSNATNVMFERACEPSGTCNNDQYSFKAYLARWMAQAAVFAPSIKDGVTNLLTTSAQAAAQSCSGDTNGTVCGQKWYVDGYDGNFGVGQQLSALETVQSLLLLHGNISAPVQPPVKNDASRSSITSPALDYVTHVVTRTTFHTSYVTV